MSKITIPRLEFYITNVCNLGCSNCNRFNDLKFSGHQLWDDYADIIREWGEYINITHPVILGGEPLLNPSIISWIKGIRETWKLGTGRPDETHGIQLLTNGTRLNQVRGLREAMRDNDCWLGVSLHDLNQFNEIDQKIREFFENDLYLTEESTERNAGGIGADWYYQKHENRGHEFAGVWTQTDFYENAIRYTDEGRMTLYNSNPTQAHENCTYRRFKNYHMIRGKIYKCGPAALFAELDDQFNLELSDKDKQLLRSYQPLTIEMAREGLTQEWFNHIDDEIPQCKFCPEEYKWYNKISIDDLYKKIRKN